MGVSAILTVLFYTGSIDPEPFLYWAYLLFGLSVVMALVFPLYFFIVNPKNALKTLLGIGLMAVVFVIGYIMADATPMFSPTNDANFSNTNVLVLTDAGLISTYVLFGVALLMLLFTGVRSVFNK